MLSMNLHLPVCKIFQTFNEDNFAVIMNNHWMDKNSNSQIVLAVEKLMENRADLMEPHLVEKVLNCDIIMPAMGQAITKIILCVVANFEVCTGKKKQTTLDIYTVIH